MSARIVEVLFPFALVLAAALLVKGYTAIGDGFSAGAVAALGAALQYASLGAERARRRVGAHLAPRFAVAALVAALVTMLGPVLLGQPPVSHFPRPGAAVLEVGLVKLHTALLLDAAVAVVVYAAFVASFDRLFPPAPMDTR